MTQRDINSNPNYPKDNTAANLLKSKVAAIKITNVNPYLHTIGTSRESTEPTDGHMLEKPLTNLNAKSKNC